MEGIDDPSFAAVAIFDLMSNARQLVREENPRLHMLLGRINGSANAKFERISVDLAKLRADICERHSSGSSMCRVTASAVRPVGCRPSTMDSTMSGARKAKRIKRPKNASLV
jgi:hypothetical protein